MPLVESSVMIPLGTLTDCICDTCGERAKALPFTHHNGPWPVDKFEVVWGIPDMCGVWIPAPSEQTGNS